MLRFEIIKNLEEAHRLWELLSPKKSLYDEWDFRYCFYKYYHPELYFKVGYLEDRLVGLLPLENDPEEGLVFFGSDYMEDNRVCIKPGFENYIPEFYHSLSGKMHLDFITGEDEFTKSLPFSDFKYVLPLNGFTTSDEYIQNYFHGETKKKLVKRLRKVEESNKIEMLINQWEDIELLFDFNIQKFQDHSMFMRPFRKEIFRDFISATSFQTRLLTFVVNGVKQAVSMSIIYKDIYASMNTGIHPEAVKDLASHIHVKKIDDALSLKTKIFDAFVRNYGWKENWHFEKIPQYKFIP